MSNTSSESQSRKAGTDYRGSAVTPTAHVSYSESLCSSESNRMTSCNDGKLIPVSGTSTPERATQAAIPSVKNILRAFLKDLPYKCSGSSPNPDLRREVMNEILSWDSGMSWSEVHSLTDTCCCIAETAYAHTSYQHQLIVAIYTTYLVYIDDQGKNNLDAVAQFARRFTRGEPQPILALERLVTILGTMHDWYPCISSDAIITNSIDSIAAMHIELSTKDIPVAPGAIRYPSYLRLKTGIGCAYAHLIFTKSWGKNAGKFYLQLLPDLELIIVGINDVLSFYKETLAGETDNYIHMRAAAEQKPSIVVLQELADECLGYWRKIEFLASSYPELMAVCRDFVMGYVEFHYNAGRYHLEDLEDGGL